MRLPGTTKVTVCDKCLTASCWHGIFMCNESGGAGTAEKTVDELDVMGLEHPDNYSRDEIERVCGGILPDCGAMPV